MSAVNYLMLYEGASRQGGFESSVRGFAKLEAAWAAMDKKYKKFAALLDIPVGHNAFSNPYTIRTKDSIRLERYGEHFKWEIIKAVAEDCEPDSAFAKDKHYGLRKYTITIEEHVAQSFPVEAHNIFFAVSSAERDYKQGSLTVQPSIPNVRLIMARDDETGETTEWKEFLMP